jgi:decaprenylphospho-beta-D-erythro-pentofuranosid-2-ulose 2-reductase
MIDATGMPQTAVVIGGTSEIARATLRSLAARRLTAAVLVGRDQGGLDAAAAELASLGVKTDTVVHDVTDAAGHRRVADEVAASLGQVDLVLMAAGVLGNGEADGEDPLAAARVLDTNCTGPAAMLSAFASVLRRQGHGRVVVLSSVAGVRVRKANYVYGAAKAGLDAFCQGLDAALEGSGASVMIVRPGWVATRMTAGSDPAPFATTAEAVAGDIVAGLGRGDRIVWSPPVLRVVFTGLRLLPTALFRKLPG